MRKIAKGILRAALWIIAGLLLLVTATVLVLYSPWAQNAVRERVVAMINDGGDMQVRLDSFRLRFPLKLDVSGVEVIAGGDTMVTAARARADVSLLPLLRGDVEVTRLQLDSAFYQIGNPDSAMWMTIRGREVAAAPVRVRLSDMDISLTDGLISDARVMMAIRPDTTPSDSTSSTRMSIDLQRLRLHNFDFEMSIAGSIDSLGVGFGDATLAGGRIDLFEQTIDARSITGERLAAAFVTADSDASAAAPSEPADSAPSKPWTIQVDTIGFTGSRALYTSAGYEPQPGLDFGYIAAESMTLEISKFYNQASAIRLPLRLEATERCGLRLAASGTFEMDSTGMYFRDFKVNTPLTELTADGMMGAGSLTEDPDLPLRLLVNGDLAFGDVKTMFPAFRPYLIGLRDDRLLNAHIDVEGTPTQLNIKDVALRMNGCVAMDLRGVAGSLFAKNGPTADVAITGRIFDVRSIAAAFLDPKSGIEIPPMTLDGHVAMTHAATRGRLNAKTLGGTLALDADYRSRTDGYDLTLHTNAFPVNAFMPDLGVGRATIDLTANGQGFDIMSAETDMDVTATIASLTYSDYEYRDIDLTAHLHDGRAVIDADSHMDDLDFDLSGDVAFTEDRIDGNIDIDGRMIDLYALHLSSTPMRLTFSATADAQVAPTAGDINASLDLHDLNMTPEVGQYTLSNVNAKFAATDTTLNLRLHNRDMIAIAGAECGIDALMASLDSVTTIIGRQVEGRRVKVTEWQRYLPEFAIDITAGDDNLINDILSQSNMSIRHLRFDATNDSLMSATARVIKFDLGSEVLDTISLNLSQNDDKMQMIMAVNNRPGNLDEWAHIRLNALLNTDRVTLRATQRNSANKTGFDIGTIVSMRDSSAIMQIFPFNPTIGYQKWTVNMDNSLKYNLYTHHIDANLKMSGAGSSLQLYTDHPKNDTIPDADGHHPQEDIVLKIGDVHIQDWIAINPFAPPMQGDLSADMHINWDGAEEVNGAGTLSLDNFYYDRQRVANVVADFDVSTNAAGTIRARTDVSIDGVRTMSLAGNLNDSTAMSPFNMNFSMIRFPLATVNPFLGANVAKMRGVLNGNMEISGDSEHPIINGTINFEDAAVRVAMLATDYKFSDVQIPVVNNLVTMKDFAVFGTNENPLTVNGTVDLSNLSKARIDLALKAKNMQIVNTTRASKGADIYGKAYLGLDATVRGNTRFLMVNANASILSGTNVTYVLNTTANEIASTTTEDMVKFVNFDDAAQVARADTIAEDGMMMALDAVLNIQNGTTINVDLPGTARDGVSIQSQGTLNYTQSPVSDGRLTGRLNINGGYARYTLPVVGSEKSFNFDPNSYVAFNGDILDPIINVHATDRVRANVTQDGQNSRIVNFDVKLGITGTLETMDVAFDLATNDDMTVANELQSMTADQRANQAMNLLLYNMYTGPNTKGSGNLTSNPLYSFLESQLNSWAANNIRGVDISFGIDQYDRTTNGMTSQTMNYSYQVSKTLFNDRFKIVIGGNYSTDADAEENFSENLISDISFEYFLNKKQTMLVKIFRHTGYESILEGEVTQTGVGFVYKRRLNNLFQMLPPFLRPRKYR